MTSELNIAIRTDPPTDAALRQRGEALASSLSLPIAGRGEARDHDVLLTVTPRRLELRVVGGPDESIVGGRAVYADLGAIDVTSPAGRSLKQPLLKAVGLRKTGQPLRVLDATAGFGEDAFLLAAFGCTVVAAERQPVVAAMLADAVRRLAATHAAVASRIDVRAADAAAVLRQMLPRPQVVCVDPMFPLPAGGRRAAERKPMKLLRLLAGDDTDATDIFEAAMRAATQRVVVKRPLRAPAMTTKLDPVAVHKGRGFRFDVYRSQA